MREAQNVKREAGRIGEPFQESDSYCCVYVVMNILVIETVTAIDHKLRSIDMLC